MIRMQKISAKYLGERRNSQKLKILLKQAEIQRQAEEDKARVAAAASIPSVKRGLHGECRRATFVLDDEVLERLALYCKYAMMRKGNYVNSLLDATLPSLEELQKKEAEADGKLMF